MEEQYEPKITLTEALFIGAFLLITDIIGILLILVGLDDFFLLDVVRFPITQIYLRIKGVKGIATLIGNILELFPYLGALPIATVTWIITVWMDHNPESIGAKAIRTAGGAVAASKIVSPAPAQPQTGATQSGPKTPGKLGQAGAMYGGVKQAHVGESIEKLKEAVS